jgi:anaerobic magnesium-protoporphyrin IX monomethyl ester cyclase
MTRCDVVLVQPPIRDFYLTKKRTIPYGLARIAACLCQAGYSVAIVDALATRRSRPLTWPEPLSDLEPLYGPPDLSPFALFRGFKHFGRSHRYVARQVTSYQPRVVGISSLFSAYADQALACLRAIREQAARTQKELPAIVFGGHHATTFAAELLDENPTLDFVIRGEGEQAMVSLCNALLRREGTIAEIAGLCRRADDGEALLSPPAIVDDLAALPPPKKELVEQAFYRHQQGGRAVVVATRGCRLRCSYCAMGTRSRRDGKGDGALPFRRSSVEAVLAELDDAIVDGGARFIDFEDENISWDKAFFLQLLAGITERFSSLDVELRAMNGLLPRTLDEPTIVAMKQAGFRSLNLSLGSSHGDRLRAYRRPDERPFFDRALLLAERHGLDAVGYVLGVGPDQDAKESVADLLYLAQRRVLAGFSVTYPAPQSAMFDATERLPDWRALWRDKMRWRSTALPFAFDPAVNPSDAASRPGRFTTPLQAVTLLRLTRLLNFAKSLLANGESLPAPHLPQKALDVGQREQSGRALLSGFLFDGVVRGLSPDGGVFEHRVCEQTTRLFWRGLEVCQLRGSR